jgi:hypothetical protein
MNPDQDACCTSAGSVPSTRPVTTEAGNIVVQVFEETWYEGWKFVYVAKRYVQDQRIAFEFGESPPTIYVYTSDPVKLARVYILPKDKGPLLIVTIGKSGRAYKHEFAYACP